MSTYAEELATRLQQLGDMAHRSGAGEAHQEQVDIIMGLVDEVKADCDRLGDELFVCYEQLNIAFDTTEQVTSCKTAQNAVLVLNKIISAAVESRFSYYLGELTQQFSLLDENGSPDRCRTIYAADQTQEAAAEAFFTRNESQLRELIEAESEGQVITIDHNGPVDHDSVGRGNVLAVRLQNIENDIGYLGTLIFVRRQEQDLFSAIHLNLAKSLVRIGAASLGNIIYAEKLQRTYLQTINSLVRAMEAKDAYTSGHSTRVAEMAVALGRKMDLSAEEMRVLEWAGLMHDIGKIGIEDAVLCKDSGLTDEEFDHIKTHPVQSEKVLEPVEGLQPVLAAVRHHHEHFDGLGYPDGLAGEDIPLLARVIQVADVWDALTSSRPYREAMSRDDALNIMREEAGTTMDPALVKVFVDILQDDPNWEPEESVVLTHKQR